jgi:hypothetical protein
MPKNPETLADILREMRGNEFDDPHLDAEGIIGARKLARDWADRIEAAVQQTVADLCADCPSHRAATISLKDALVLANTIANHGISASDLGEEASRAIYALCHEVREVRHEDAQIKKEVQELRRKIRDGERRDAQALAPAKAEGSVK